MELLILAGAAMALVAALRVVRVHLGREPGFEGKAKLLFVLAFVFLPPMALGVLTATEADTSLLRGVASVPIYGFLLLTVMVAMWIAALVVSMVVVGRPRRLLLLALIGRHGDPDDLPRNPPVSARLAESLATVKRANSAFSRGVAFPDEIDRPGFREDWEALEGATRTLEGQIAEDYQLGVGVATVAADTSQDARSRLNTLRRLATHNGRAWAG